MNHEINIPEIVGEVEDSFERYNAAVESGDADLLNGFFWSSANTVRLGHAEHLFGYAEIATFRTRQWKRGAPRRLERLAITTLGRDFATTNALFCSLDGTGRISRQSQTWVRFPEGWRIVAAHVSTLPV